MPHDIGPNSALGRRGFLKSAVVAGAVAAVPTMDAGAEESAKAGVRTAGPSPWLTQAEAPVRHPVTADSVRAAEYVAYPGSDYMVDVMKALNIDYIAVMPGATTRGLHESIINYGLNKKPEMIECVHEEVAAAICHGYAKAANKPMACLVHSDVGLLHASMAVFNAWCDRVPVIALVGNTVTDETKRSGMVEWMHSAQDVAAPVRDFVKYDDAPKTLQSFGESMMRGYSIATTAPQEPVVIVVDPDLQESEIEAPKNLRIPALPITSMAVGDAASLKKAAAMLLSAKNPLIVADRYARTDAAIDTLVALAELLNARVWNMYGRMNFPTRHYLNQSSNRAALAEADVILGLELTDLYSLTNAISDTTHRSPSRRLIRADAKVIDINASYLYSKSNYGDQARFFPADLRIAADSEATLPYLLAEVRAAITSEQKAAFSDRKSKHRQDFAEMMDRDKSAATKGWDDKPISTARLSMEIWNVIKNEKWSMVSSTFNVSFWPQRLWDFKEAIHDMGGPGGYGVGYGLPAAVGSALAMRGSGRIPVNIQADGDFMMLPGTLWTMAHHNIPLLTIMHNNRAWHQETMHLVRMANRRGRNNETWQIGTTIVGPNIDYATMAKSMGVWAEGPITEPEKLGSALRRALQVVKSGRPALLDVITAAR